MSNQIAIVTGGARGLGLAIATTLKENGFKVILLDRDESALKALGDFEGYTVDLTDAQAVEKVFEKLFVTNPKIHLLVNNAGVIYNEPLVNPLNPAATRHSLDSFKKIVDINLHTVFHVGSIVAEKMVKTRAKGTIVNISSISARGNIGQSAYAASKAGVNALTKVWAKELGPYGISVAGIAPGFINTDSTQTALSQEIIDSYKKKTPLRRLGAMEDIANTVLFLAGNTFVSGTVLDVDGGMTL